MMTDQQRPVVLGIGEALWDCFGDDKRPGGAPANFAYHAAQLGCEAYPCSRVGRDELGDALVDLLQGRGVAVDLIQRDDDRPTGTVSVDDSRPEHPVYTIHEGVAWDALAWTPSLEEACSRAAGICFGTLAQRCEIARETIRRCIGATPPGAMIVCDVNLRQAYFSREVIESSLKFATLLKLNEDEVGVLARLLEWPESIDDFPARAIDRFSLDAVCVTRGGKGCLMRDKNGETADVAGRPVEVADAVGAGDSFTAAWCVARLKGLSLQRQAETANRVGGLIASRPGAMPPIADEYHGLLAEMGQ